MLHTLYLLFIAPLEFLMRLVLEWGFSLTHSWGWSLVLLSLAVNTAILPISNWAEHRQEEERELRRIMARHEAMLRACFRGQERFALLAALRRVSGYDWRLSLRGGAGLLLQIPFFIAAYHLLSGFGPLRGQGFGPLPDLGAPDGLLSGVNLLPFVMTAANLLAAFVYARDLSRRDKFQIYGVALLFLALLYPAASALVLYWTLNNVYSLGKNILVKDLMRRPAWRSFQNRRGKRFGEIVVRRVGDKRIQAALRFVESARCGLPATAAFFLIICWCRLIAHEYQIDPIDGINIRIFASQCFLTYLLVTLTLYCLRIPWAGSKLSKNKTLLSAGIFILFVLQADVLLWRTLLVTSKNIYFDMWGAKGIVFFCLWIFAVIILDKFDHKVRSALKSLHKLSLDNIYDPLRHSLSGRHGALAENTRQSIIWAGCVGALSAFFICYYIPLLTYLHNVNEFAFDAPMLFLEMSKWSPLVVVLFSLFLFMCSFVFQKEYVMLPWKKNDGVGGAISLIHIIALIVFFILSFEGSILSYRLPMLDGNSEVFNSPGRLLFDSVFCMAILYFGIKFWRYLAKRIYFFIFLLMVFFTASLLDACSGAEKKRELKVFTGDDHLFIVDEYTLYSRLTFSNTENTIIILVDSLDTLAFEKMLELYPENRNIFAGFRLFRENLGAGGITRNAVPAILRGDVQRKGDGNYLRNAFVGNESLAAMADKFGRSVFIDAGQLGRVVRATDTDSVVNYTKPERVELKGELVKLAFRFFPYFVKRLCVDAVNFQDQNLRLHGVDRDTRTFRQIFARLDSISAEPVLHFYYFWGTHLPFLKKDIFETADDFFKKFDKFMTLLKQRNLYDKTTIMIMSDHGLTYPEHDHRSLYPERNGKYSTFLFPLFLVKTPDSSGPMSIHDALTSSLYAKDMIMHFYSHGATRDALRGFLDALPAERIFYFTGNGNEKYLNPVIMKARGTFGDLRFEPVESGGF